MNKTIDLTPIVGAQVLCEFWNDDHDYCLSMLVDIQDDGTFVAYSNSERGKEFTNCRIYHHPDYWISNADFQLVSYSIILVMTPAPTVRPPSRIANLSSFSIAMGVWS